MAYDMIPFAVVVPRLSWARLFWVRLSWARNAWAALAALRGHLDGKRLLDVTLVLLALPVWGPLLLALVGLLRLRQGPGVFFLHPRIGRDGREFRMIKLRTMVPDAPDRLAPLLADPRIGAHWARHAKLPEDPRRTPLGRWLRDTSLDELPQMINVLLGQMSLVGPRPVPQSEFAAQYSGASARAYLSLRPGVSGLWQVTARGGSYDRRLALDCYYAESRSLMLDLRILLRTFGAVWNGTGA